jgi:hypothetical protein
MMNHDALLFVGGMVTGLLVTLLFFTWGPP